MGITECGTPAQLLRLKFKMDPNEPESLLEGLMKKVKSKILKVRNTMALVPIKMNGSMFCPQEFKDQAKWQENFATILTMPNKFYWMTLTTSFSKKSTNRSHFMPSCE